MSITLVRPTRIILPKLHYCGNCSFVVTPRGDTNSDGLTLVRCDDPDGCGAEEYVDLTVSARS